MNANSRIKKIEQARGTGERKKYLCVINEYNRDYETKGYKVQSFDGKDLHFNTRAELDTFAARPDIDLTLVRVVSASEDIKHKDGDE